MPQLTPKLAGTDQLLDHTMPQFQPRRATRPG
jgi:hypothetical protein